MCGVTLGTPDIIPPMLSAAKIIMRFLARMAGQARIRDHLVVKAFKGNDLRFVAAGVHVVFAGAVTRLTTHDLPLPG